MILPQGSFSKITADKRPLGLDSIENLNIHPSKKTQCKTDTPGTNLMAIKTGKQVISGNI
jgi:serine/threonine protein kinase